MQVITYKHVLITGDTLCSLRGHLLPGAALHRPRVLAPAAEDLQGAHSHPGTDLHTGS